VQREETVAAAVVVDRIFGWLADQEAPLSEQDQNRERVTEADQGDMHAQRQRCI
jgi:hypothetical protein